MWTGILISALILCAGLWAQNPDRPDDGVRPLLGDPAKKLGSQAAPAPRTADGKPDLSGIWEPPGIRFALDITSGLKDVPFTATGAEIFKQRKETNGKDDPEGLCLPPGVPRITYTPYPSKIIPMPGLMLILYEAGTRAYRQIFMDGRPVPKDPDPTWFGYSVGRWEGDTLVVETSGFNDRTWLDGDGHPHSDAMRVIERYRRTDLDHIEYKFLIDDPKMYTKPWENATILSRIPNYELKEYICNENNRDLPHLVGK
jgi:hypothetical protein